MLCIMQSLEEQFQHGSNIDIAQYISFKFKDDREPAINVNATKQNDQYVLGFQPANAKVGTIIKLYYVSILSYSILIQIKGSDISFWDRDFAVMQRKHEMKMYPPRVKMTVSIKDPNTQFVLPVKFSGCRNDGELDMDITLPLGMNTISLC